MCHATDQAMDGGFEPVVLKRMTLKTLFMVPTVSISQTSKCSASRRRRRPLSKFEARGRHRSMQPVVSVDQWSRST